MADKRCPRCATAKSVDDFYRNRAQSDGLDGWCKDCRGGHAAVVNRTFRVRRQRAAANKRYRVRHRLSTMWGTGEIE